MENFDVTQIRDIELTLAPNLNVDEKYTFFYDETNNIKKLYQKDEESFNTSFDANFILGGILYEGERPELDDIFKDLNLQPNINEVKFKHIASGCLEDCLKSKKLDTILNRIYESPLYIHYTSLNFLYWSIVDIVDSALVNFNDAIILEKEMKNNLYSICRIEIDDIKQLFYEYKYPNISSDDIEPFIRYLIAILEKYKDESKFHIGVTTLIDILEKAIEAEEMPFIMDEQDHIMLNSLHQFYFKPIYMFINSLHIFDNEEEIQTKFNEYKIIYNDKEINSYSFIDSKDDQFIQLSDVVVGILGKLSKFINTSTIDEIIRIIQEFSEQQLKTLDSLLKLVCKSHDKNIAFLHSVDSYDYTEKMSIIYALRGE